MKSSAELLRGMKSQVRWLVGILVLSVLWKWLGLPSTAAMKSADNTLFEMVGGAVAVLGFWIIDCTEIIIAGIKEQAGSHK